MSCWPTATFKASKRSASIALPAVPAMISSVCGTGTALR